jgi:hypothetical protein
MSGAAAATRLEPSLWPGGALEVSNAPRVVLRATHKGALTYCGDVAPRTQELHTASRVLPNTLCIRLNISKNAEC